ncbi:inorganic phosphate cotransporter [Schistosoma japonicum]|nr:inorganic phosphate cotransporter [Schistosoma japonicum]
MKCLSERMVLSLVLCLGTINMLAQRVNLSIAILCMTNHSSINENDSVNDKHTMNDNSTSSICSIQSLNKTEYFNLLDDDGWPICLGSFKSGNSSWNYFLGLFSWTDTCRYPYSKVQCSLSSTYISNSYEHINDSCSTRSNKVPVFILCCTCTYRTNIRLHIGSAISMPITGALCQTSLGWSLVFYFYGAFSFLYCIIWFIFVYDEPKTHPRISLKEKIYLESSCPIIKNDKKGKIPFKSILTSLPVWAFVFVNIGIDWNLYTFLTSVPTYMREVLHFDFQRNALLSSIPYIGMWIGQILFGMFGPAILMILITLFDCRYKYVVVILLTFGLFLSSGVFSGGMLSPIEITPKYSGFLFSASNSVGALTGFLTPVVANALTPDKTFEQWRYVFYLGAAIFLIAGLFFLLFSSFTVQSWAIEVTDTSSDNDHSFIDKTVNNTIHSIDKIDMKNHDEQFDQIQLNEVSII